MHELALHLGAHRTATTSLQTYLSKNKEALTRAGIDFLIPPQTRERSLDPSILGENKRLISEENILGTMENCVWQASLYPDVERNLLRYESWLNDVSIVFFSIRNLPSWWDSALFFHLKKGLELPDEDHLQAIADNGRSWDNVVDDIRSVIPSAKLVVREFGWKTDNPKQQLLRLTNWPGFTDTKLDRRIVNARVPANELTALLAKRGEFNTLSRLSRRAGLNLFSAAQKKTLEDRYNSDLQKLARRSDITFWHEKNSDIRVSDTTSTCREGSVRGAPEIPSKTIVLHIGKTGGTFLKSAFDVERHSSDYVKFGKHGDTLITTLENHGPQRKLGFLFRNPADRFVSGFLSRLRQGRPRYDVNWTTAEAVAFSFFEDPNSLAEALTSTNERLKSAAIFSFQSIFHLKLGYQHYLHSSDAVHYEHSRGNILFCVETEKIDRYLGQIAQLLKFTETKTPGLNRNFDRESHETNLSPRALKNLKAHWNAEYQIFNTCRKVSTELGFGG
ncbi:hypothetical protein [Aliiroseovarius sp. F47248L]|uniref:hypothetical protein n=1 Tax=Aliiroseovarius sp. F47248L TaxID=2926420 RepID=UPI001FF2D5EF|nr:hypothetical protein [Aliiroseovarius sp. F47248L]MCK0138103.1 hypothetical protein [Aliiroseovarius sp. F47248L]